MTLKFCGWSGSPQTTCSENAFSILSTLNLSGTKQQRLEFTNFRIGKLVDKRESLSLNYATATFDNCLFTGDAEIELRNIGTYSFVNSQWRAHGNGSRLSFAFRGYEVYLAHSSVENVVFLIEADVSAIEEQNRLCEMTLLLIVNLFTFD